MLNVYCSLRKCHDRVSPKLLKEHYRNSKDFRQGCTEETTYWLVPKSNFQKGLPPRLAEFEVSPETVDKLLPQAQDIDLAQYHIPDKACDRAPLGKNISQVRFHINSSETLSRKESTSTPSLR